jgi:hypothetical protein
MTAIPESVLMLVDPDADVDSVAKKFIELPPPEQTLQETTSRPPYGRIAVGAMRILDQLLRKPDLVDELPAVSIILGERTLGPSSEVAYKTLAISLAYYSLYCIERLGEADGESLTDALGLAMRPSMFAIEGKGDLFAFAQSVRHAITVCAGAYWLRSFSELPEISALQYHFLRPIAVSASVLLNLTGLPDPIFNWGVSTLCQYTGRILFECTQLMEQDILDHVRAGKQVNISRMVRLAQKDSQLHKSLGTRLYTEFEEELKLLFQSFGYFVSHTRPGKRRVDLVVAAPPPYPYVFLVEAKSCKSAYSLPASDERALREYISVYQQDTHTLPPLRFVLITSSKPTRTLGGKLARLTASEGVPIRFVSAQELGFLRYNLHGTIHPKLLLDSIDSAEDILDRQWAEGIIRSVEYREQIFDVTVQNVFGEVPTRLPWRTSDERLILS